MSVAMAVSIAVAATFVVLVLVRRPRRCSLPGCTSPVGYHVHVGPPDGGPAAGPASGARVTLPGVAVVYRTEFGELADARVARTPAGCLPGYERSPEMLPGPGLVVDLLVDARVLEGWPGGEVEVVAVPHGDGPRTWCWEHEVTRCPDGCDFPADDGHTHGVSR